MPSSAIGAGAARYSRPLTRTRPAVGSSRPAIIRIVVDFPAPLGPTKPVTRPGSTVNDTPSSATAGPNLLRRPVTSIVASMRMVISSGSGLVRWHLPGTLSAGVTRAGAAGKPMGPDDVGIARVEP